ncbi:maltase A3-like [Neocloeon triangulifer]|uniref:maltase A3-like n=1 Tax=Neocloeon triangulifer TaxID=2078957 RepID=UPI00286F44CE|nr:maltase A3-like [Neocloeon triangulifer]
MFLKLFLASVLAASVFGQDDPNWYKTATYYQVYPRSLKDTNGDGIGDLKGITQSIPFMKSLGVDCIWLSPIYKSPMKDFGYDIADFYSIDPIFGTWEDFEELLATIKAAGLRLLMDLIPNHTSNEHEWFIKSVQGQQPYADYYVWKPSKGIDANGSQIPPNNWLSAFAGSAWEWREERQMFYLHQFTVEQPDLDYRSPLVLAEMQNVFRFWLQKGVDGFRIDAPAHIWEHEDFLDEPPSNDPNCPAPDQFCALNHTYVKDQEQVYDILYAFRTVVDEFEASTGEIKVLMSEASGELDLTMRYYGNETHNIIHFPFNFYLIWEISNATDARGVEAAIRHWLDAMPVGRTANYVLGNHDNGRLASRVGADFAMTNQMIAFLLPGAMISYMGEEINMENTFITWAQTQDPQGCNAGPDLYQRFSRDPQRTPFQWDDSNFAGFTNGSNTWLPVNENYLQVNVAAQQAALYSPLKIYQRLAEARKSAAVKNGSFDLRVVNDDVIAFTRVLTGEINFLVVANTAYEARTVNVDATFFPLLPIKATVFTASVDSPIQQGDSVFTSVIDLAPRGGVVLTF